MDKKSVSKMGYSEQEIQKISLYSTQAVCKPSSINYSLQHVIFDLETVTTNIIKILN